MKTKKIIEKITEGHHTIEPVPLRLKVKTSSMFTTNYGWRNRLEFFINYMRSFNYSISH